MPPIIKNDEFRGGREDKDSEVQIGRENLGDILDPALLHRIEGNRLGIATLLFPHEGQITALSQKIRNTPFYIGDTFASGANTNKKVV